MFLTNVLRRPDYNASFWKERFITGLPNLFSQQIMNNLQKEMRTDVISFENISFGQLFAFVKKEGLDLCSELKLQIKYGSERK